MSKPDNLHLAVYVVPKGDLNKKTLYPILANDNDFSENEEQYRDDTLALGYKDEAERVSMECYDKVDQLYHHLPESDFLHLLVAELFNVPGFIGRSSYYGDYNSIITETPDSYVISLAYLMC